MSKKDEAKRILEDEPHIDYTELAERVGYASDSSAYKAKQEFQEENPSMYGDSNNNSNTNNERQESDRRPTDSNDEFDAQGSDGSSHGNDRQSSERDSGILLGNGDDSSDRSGHNDRSRREKSEQGSRPSDDSGRAGSEADDRRGGGIIIDESREGKQAKQSGTSRSPIADTAGERTSEIVSEADDPEEQQRRAEFLEDVDERAVEDEETGEKVGIDVDQELLEKVFKSPFNGAAEITGYEGWRVSDEEAATNAELLKSYCEENNIDVSTGTLLAISLSQTVGTRTAGYMKYRKEQSDDVEEEMREEVEEMDEELSDDQEDEPDDVNELFTDVEDESGNEIETEVEADEEIDDDERFDPEQW